MRQTGILFFIHLALVIALGITIIGCGSVKNTDAKSTNSAETVAPVEVKSIFKTLQDKNDLTIEERIAFYHQLKKDHADEYDFSDEHGLNQYGYWLLEQRKTKEAIEIFKLLVSEFPESANAYDSLGEGYMNDNDDARAILNYEKSVELNPKNNHAIDQITILKGMEILVTDWGKEFFHFPIHFAPSIPFTGVEEVVFPRNWIKPDSADFWSYVFVWEIGNRTAVAPEELEAYLKIYFDGLMDGINGAKGSEIMKTRTSFELNDDPVDSVNIVGKVTVFDAFATMQPLDLNARIYSNYCEETEKLILLFRFSPQAYDHEVWDLLRTVQVRSTICEKMD